MNITNIIILHQGEKYEAWGSLTELCRKHTDFSYHYLKQLKFPFDYKGWHFERVPFRQLHASTVPPY